MNTRLLPSRRWQVIGLTGPADAGKDTVAQLLATHARFYPIAFADALRGEICNAYQIDAAYLTARSTKEQPMRALALDRCLDRAFVDRMIARHLRCSEGFSEEAPRSPRQILQWWGTDYRRDANPRHWLAPVIARVTQLHRQGTAHHFVLSDVRFPNEAALVRAWGGLLWQIKRPGRGRAPDGHASDTEGDELRPDTVIDNRYDIRHLQQQVLSTWWGHDAGFAPGAVHVEIAA